MTKRQRNNQEKRAAIQTDKKIEALPRINCEVCGTAVPSDLIDLHVALAHR